MAASPEAERLRASIRRPDLASLDRRRLFESVSAPYKPEDFPAKIAALAELTNEGKDVASFESAIVSLVTSWLHSRFEAANEARKKDKEKGVRSSGLLVEEANLNRIYGYIIDLVRFNYNVFKEEEICSILDQLLHICKKTTASSDIKRSVQIMDALVTYGEIPRCMLEPCLDVLCGAYATVRDLVDPIWSAVYNLCKSHTAQNTVTALLDILRSPSGHGGRNTNTLRGAVLILKRLWVAKGADGLVAVKSCALLDAFHSSLATDSVRLELELVDAILSVLEDGEFATTIIQEGDWATLLNLLSHCSSRATIAKKVVLKEGSTDKSSREIDYGGRIFKSLTQAILHLTSYCSERDFEHRHNVMEFFMAVARHLPDATADLLVRYFVEEQLCYPSNASWLVDTNHLVSAFLWDPKRPAAVRLQILHEIRQVYNTVADLVPSDVLAQFIKSAFDGMADEVAEEVMEILKTFAIEVASHPDDAISAIGFGALEACLPIEGVSRSGAVLAGTSESPATNTTSKSRKATKKPQAMEAAVQGLCAILTRALNTSARKASQCFLSLLAVCQSKECSNSARVLALRLLFRLRSDSSHSVYLTRSSECEDLAVTLGRTEASRDQLEKAQEAMRNRQSRHEGRGTRNSSGAGHLASASSSTSQLSDVISRPLGQGAPWLYESEHTPSDEPSSGWSSLIFSDKDVLANWNSKPYNEPGLLLDIKLWLEALISVCQQEDDWEVYSYVLVHLASQLSNHSLFVHAVPQIKLLRSVLCEQLRVGSFREPPSASGLKKSDVMTCLFHTLTILLTYSQHFSKNEDDEIVRTFMVGVGSGERTAKYCIHALAVCCHELPLSISKSLNSILQKMSQIVTQSQVAVHVLEFLAGLARLPEVYVNFREEDYRTVFGVCFRYLQSVRDQRQRSSDAALARGSNVADMPARPKREAASTTEASSLGSHTANELPQYVNALAYHVIIYWFLSVKLVDRAKYTGWITKNLIVVDSAGREVVDELSQITIDLMQRVTYSDHDESMPNPRVEATSDEPVAKKSWLVGMSILTLETALRSGTTLVTKRQPSATSYWTYQSRVANRPRHQVPISSSTITDAHDESWRVEVLPSHVLLQLMSSTWRTPASMRPIPLPDDEATRRAISLFDRNSTVDGHKVGVIYIAEGQTAETEILANVCGSDDFMDFLAELGTLVRLRGAKMNPQGLDVEMDMDGEYTFCWRDRVTEIVFHIPVLMPTDALHDPQCIGKKRHTGNDFVNIIFNNSGLPFRFDTFPSDFNYVNIVITPEARPARHVAGLPAAAAAAAAATAATGATGATVAAAVEGRQRHGRFYKVQVMSKPGFPQVSPAAETKVLSARSLPAFVRLIALNASVFSLVWSDQRGGEHISSWRNRLREIVRLRERHAGGGGPASAAGSTVHSPLGAPTAAAGVGTSSGGGGGGGGGGSGGGANTAAASAAGGSSHRESLKFRRTSGPGFFGGGDVGQRSSMMLPSASAAGADMDGWAHAEGESLVDGYDFSKWAS